MHQFPHSFEVSYVQLARSGGVIPVLLYEFLEGVEDVLDVGLVRKDGIERARGRTRRPEGKYLLRLLDNVAPSKGELDVL